MPRCLNDQRNGTIDGTRERSIDRQEEQERANLVNMRESLARPSICCSVDSARMACKESFARSNDRRNGTINRMHDGTHGGTELSTERTTERKTEGRNERTIDGRKQQERTRLILRETLELAVVFTVREACRKLAFDRPTERNDRRNERLNDRRNDRLSARPIDRMAGLAIDRQEKRERAI